MVVKGTVGCMSPAGLENPPNQMLQKIQSINPRHCSKQAIQAMLTNFFKDSAMQNPNKSPSYRAMDVFSLSML